jgi:hypothetical protein
MRLSHPMKILTILIGTLVLNMFDASNCRADETVTEAMLRAESLGGLRLGLPEKDVLKLLGSPATRGELVFQEADGNYVQDWHYPDKGIELLMSAGEKKSGVKTIANITASAPCTLATRKASRSGTRRAPRVRLTPSMSIAKQGPIPAPLSWVLSTAASSSISPRAR